MPAHTEVNDLAISNEPLEQFNLEDEKLATRKVDAALQFLRAEQHGEIIDVNERRLLWKIDLMIMPLLFGAYLR